MPIQWSDVTSEEWDVARRAADQVNVHVLAQGTAVHGRYVAIRLSDGGSDGNLYDTRVEAIRHQMRPDSCAYSRIAVGGTTPKQMWIFIVYMRQVYENGGRFSQEAPRLPTLSEELGLVVPRLGRALRPGRIF